MELRDLYNENKELINKTILKGEKIPEDCYLLVVIVIMQNNDGKFLIQKRSENKGGQWALTGGHPKTGETSLQGLLTEVKEELGIDINNPILFKEDKGKDLFYDLYYLKQDIKLENIIMQEEEVSDVKYATIEEIEYLYKNNEFKKSHYMIFKDCLEFFKNN